MSISIGINENVYLAKAEKTEEGVLVLGFANPPSEEGTAMKEKLEANPFADWEEGELTYNEGSNGRDIRLFPFDNKPSMNKPDDIIDATIMKERIAALRDPLTHILMGYMTKDKNPLKPSVIFKGTGIDKDINDYAKKIMSETVQAKVYENIVNAFIEAMQPFLGDHTKLFRVKLPRQSKAKAFATIPTRFISDDSPFWESMDIPAKASKVRFSTWEIANGFDKADVIQQAAADKVVEEEPEEDPFANR